MKLEELQVYQLSMELGEKVLEDFILMMRRIFITTREDLYTKQKHG